MVYTNTIAFHEFQESKTWEESVKMILQICITFFGRKLLFGSYNKQQAADSPFVHLLVSTVYNREYREPYKYESLYTLESELVSHPYM